MERMKNLCLECVSEIRSCFCADGGSHSQTSNFSPRAQSIMTIGKSTPEQSIHQSYRSCQSFTTLCNAAHVGSLSRSISSHWFVTFHFR